MKNRCYADITHKNLILFMFPFLYWSQAIYCVVGTNEIQLETSLKRSEEEKLTKKKIKTSSFTVEPGRDLWIKLPTQPPETHFS